MLKAAFWLLAAACCLPPAAFARDVLELDAARQPVQLRDWGDAWLDAGGAAAVETVATDSGIPWAPTRANGIYPLKQGQALWIRFTIPPAPDAERWYLEIPYPSVNKVTLYTPDSVGKWLPQSAGDTLPVADWPVPHRHPLLPVAVSAEEPGKHLLRIENPHGFSAPLSFVSESYLSRTGQRTSLILGIYFGLAGLAVLMGVLSAISLRDRAYGVYALAVALMGITQAATTGIAGLHLWPHWPWWGDLAPLVLPVLTTGALMWFFTEVISLSERARRLNAGVLVLGALGVLVAAAVILLDPSGRAKLMVAYVVISSASAISIMVWAATRGDRYAPWLLVGALPVMVGAAFPIMRISGLIPVSFYTVHGMQMGIAIELPVLLVILMVRSQHRREHNRRIQGIDRIDPATGLLNRAMFEQSLVRMMARSTRLKYESAVLVVDIVNIEAIRRDFGARSAEELPLRVAGRLLGAARDIDAVARLAPHRFGMLVEGPLTPEDAASEGPRIVARCLMPFKNKPMEWVAQVRVAQTIVPTERADAHQVLDRLEALLANVSPDSKKAVFALRS